MTNETDMFIIAYHEGRWATVDTDSSDSIPEDFESSA